MVSEGGNKVSRLHTYRSVFSLNGTCLSTADEHFMEVAEEGNLIYGEGVNIFNQEMPYTSGRYRVSQRSML